MDRLQQPLSVRVLDQPWMKRSRMLLLTRNQTKSTKQSMTCRCWRELFKLLLSSIPMSWWKKHIDITRSSEHQREKDLLPLLHLLHRQRVLRSQDWLLLTVLLSRVWNKLLDSWMNSRWRGQTWFTASSWEVKDQRHLQTTRTTATLLHPLMSNLHIHFFTEDYLNTTMDCPTIRESWWLLTDITFPLLLRCPLLPPPPATDVLED